MTCHFPTPFPPNTQRSGHGSPVMLLHGSASNAKQWRSSVDYLKGRFEVLTPDLPGNGKSAGFLEQSQTIDASARHLKPFLDHVDGPVHLVGHSFGGAVALKIATLWPERVRSLTLIEPAAFSAFWTEHGFDHPLTRAFLQMGAAAHRCFAKGEAHAAMRHFIDFWNGSGAWDRTSRPLQDKLTPCMAQVLRDFDALTKDVMTDHDLAGVVCPVQILRGDASPQVMATLTGHLTARLPFASEKVFAGAGHMLPLTDPHLVDPAIGDFLAKVDQTWRSCNYPMARAA